MSQKKLVPVPSHRDPLDVRTHAGEVVIVGPHAIHGAFEADAAHESGERLIAAAEKAKAKSGS